MKYTYYSEKDNCLYIKTKELLPNTDGLTFKQHCNAQMTAFKKTYEERLKLYACDECKKEVKEQLEKHKGCKVSEYCNA